MSSELRRDVRKRTFLKGQVIFNNASSTMDCLVRDLTEHGARLELSQTATLPEVFELRIQNRDAKYRATLCWRRDDSVGVLFGDRAREPASAPAVDASVSALLRRISELEAENAALRSLLAKMSRPTAA